MKLSQHFLVFVLVAIATLFCSNNSAISQTVGPGTYDLPDDGNISSRQVIGSSTTVNVFAGGEIGNVVDAGQEDQVNQDVVVNLFDGTIGYHFDANSGSEVNVFGGSVGYAFDANAGSVVNISGGTFDLFNSHINRAFYANSGSEVNISGGVFGNMLSTGSAVVNFSGGRAAKLFQVIHGSELNLSGGSVNELRTNSTVNVTGGAIGKFEAQNGSSMLFAGGNGGLGSVAENGSSVLLTGGVIGSRFQAETGSRVKLSGGEFLLNGNAVSGNVAVAESDLLTGTLEDGSPFIFSGLNGDNLFNVELLSGSIPSIEPSSIIVDDENSPGGIRAGETLTLEEPGVLRDDFSAVGATLNVNGGAVGRNLEMIDTLFTMSGGETQAIVAYSSTLDLGGGRSSTINAYGSSEVEFSGDAYSFITVIHQDASVQISDGTVANLSVNSGAEAQISGGIIGGLRVYPGGTAVVSGGAIEEFYSATEDATVTLRGEDFRLNGQSIIAMPSDAEIPFNSVFTGTLEDGSVFIFRRRYNVFDGVTLITATVAAADTTTISVATDNTTLTGLRPGQSLDVIAGGTILNEFRSVDANITVNGGRLAREARLSESTMSVSDGRVGRVKLFLGSQLNITGGLLSSAEAFEGSEINISGGIGEDLELQDGSELNISGGNATFFAEDGSAVNLFATEFFVDGESLDISPGDSVVLSDREITLTGTFSDGSPFSYELSAFYGSGFEGTDYVSSNASITLFNVSEASVLGDVNLDGAANFSDISPFIAVLVGGHFQIEADCNEDESVDFFDIWPFVGLLSNQ